MSYEKKGPLPPDGYNPGYNPQFAPQQPYAPGYGPPGYGPPVGPPGAPGPSAPFVPGGPGPSAPLIVPEEAPPAYSAAPPAMYPPPQPMAPPMAGYNPYQQQAYAAGYSPPPPGPPVVTPPLPPGVQPPPPMPPAGPVHTPMQYPGQPQPPAMVVQVTPQMSEQQATTGVIRRSSSNTGCCSCKSLWQRKNGFCCGGGLAIFSILICVAAYISGKNLFELTKDYKEGTCTSYDKILNNDTVARCEKPGCQDNECSTEYTEYPCYMVMGRIHYTDSNQSALLQIYADSTEMQKGACSYRPMDVCKSETESAFHERLVFEGLRFPCYYPPSENMHILLKKNEPVGYMTFVVPGFLLVVGILILLAVKFCGHNCGCPSQSQLIKQQQRQQPQQQQQSQQQMQLQPLVSR